MTPEEREVVESVRHVGGWLTDREAALLYTLARRCSGAGAIVEIGSWKGRSTICLAKGTRVGSQTPVYAIDPHTGMGGPYGANTWTFDEFKANIAAAGVEEAVIPLVQTSQDAVQEFEQPVELLFIDGGHDYDSVRRDFELWFPKVMDGGVIAFHDAAWSPYDGPRRLVRERVYLSRRFRNASFIQRGLTIIYATKVQRNAPLQWLRNAVALGTKELVDAAYRIRAGAALKTARS